MAPKKKSKSTALVPARNTRDRQATSFDDSIEETEIITGPTTAPARSTRRQLDAADEIEDQPVQDAGLARYSATPAFDASDLFIPRLRLAQGLTAEVQSGQAKPGDWLVLGADPMKAPTVIPMLMVRRRELRDNDEGRAVLCRSSDSIIGVGNPGGECASCPMNQWTPSRKPGGKNTAPPCNFIYSYIVFVVETEELCVLEFYRTSLSTGRMLNTMVLQKGLGKFAVQLKASNQQGPRGTYYQPTLQPAKIKEAVFKIAQQKASEMF